jgi:methylase of polypeptide subunit release factors
MVNIKTIKLHQKAFLKRVKEKTKPSYYLIQSIEIKVNPNVFPPATDTKLLAENIKITKGERILDLTSGSGIISVITGLQGATGIATDINPKAVENSIENFKNYSIKVEAIVSNLYEKVPDEKFDQIFANGPYIEGKIKDPLDYACYGAKQFINNVLSDLNTRLKPGGRLLITLSIWSDLKYFNKLIAKYNLKSKLISKKNSNDRKRTYLLYEIRLKK